MTDSRYRVTRRDSFANAAWTVQYRRAIGVWEDVAEYPVAAFAWGPFYSEDEARHLAEAACQVLEGL